MTWNISSGNPLALLGVAAREDTISRLLVVALAESDPDLRSQFLAIIAPNAVPPTGACAWIGGSQIWVPNGRADIVLAWRNPSGVGSLVVVEHKLNAKEHNDQTSVYAAQAAQDALHTSAATHLLTSPRGGHVTEWRPTHFAYLTLFEEDPSSEAFVNVVRHRELLDWFERAATSEATARKLIGAWHELVLRFHDREKTADSGTFTEALGERGDDPLDGRFGVFERLTRQIANGAGLEWHGCYRTSPSGRAWYGCHLAKSGWHPGAEALQERGDWKARYRSTHDFWIHFQVRFDLLRALDVDEGELVLSIQYECLPYMPQPEFGRVVPDDGARAAYRARREEFSRHSQMRSELTALGWRFRGNWNQVAKKVLRFDRDTSWNSAVAAAAKAFRDATAPVERAVPPRQRLSVSESNDP